MPILNNKIYISAFAGALSGMGVSNRIPKSENPADYTALCNAAGAFAEAVDTEFASMASTSLDQNILQSICEAIWMNRTPAFSGQWLQSVNYQREAAMVVAIINAADIHFINKDVSPDIDSGGEGVALATTDSDEFSQPARGGSVQVPIVGDGAGFQVGMMVYIPGAGYYRLTNRYPNEMGTIILSLRNDGSEGNTNEGETIPGGQSVFAAGEVGPYYGNTLGMIVRYPGNVSRMSELGYSIYELSTSTNSATIDGVFGDLWTTVVNNETITDISAVVTGINHVTGGAYRAKIEGSFYRHDNGLVQMLGAASKTEERKNGDTALWDVNVDYSGVDARLRVSGTARWSADIKLILRAPLA